MSEFPPLPPGLALLPAVLLIAFVPAQSAQSAAPAPNAAAAVPLRFSLPAGAYTLTVETRLGAANVNGADADTDPSVPPVFQRSETRTAVIDLAARPPAADGTQTVRATYRRLRCKLKHLDQDTDAPPFNDDPVLPRYRDLLNVPFDVTLNARGVPQSVSGMKALFDRLNDFEPSRLREANLHTLRSQFGETMLLGWVSWVRGELPPGPVRPGESWPSTLIIPVPSLPKLRPLELNQNWTLKSVDRSAKPPVAEITVAGSASATFDNRAIAAALGVADVDTFKKVRVSATTEGKLTRDLATAQARRAAWTTETVLNVTVKGNAGAADETATIRQPIAVTMSFAPSTAP